MEKVQCFCCGKEINIIDKNDPIQDSDIDGGIIELIHPGYSSRYDNMRFIITICDDCLLKNKDRLIQLGDEYGDTIDAYDDITEVLETR